MDFHTHNMEATPGTAIVNLPKDILLHPSAFEPQSGGLYSAGIHPWWTDDTRLEALFDGLYVLLRHPQVVALGECGLDRLRGITLGEARAWEEGMPLTTQNAIFWRQVQWAEQFQKPVTIHCVRAFDVLLADKKQMRPRQRWTIHGFRGKPALARQLLKAGFDLSFGEHHNAESFALTPPDRRHIESDDGRLPLLVH